MRHNNTRHLVLTALFVAMILLLGFTPMGLIPLGFINITILCVPVVIGTIVLGLKTGIVLGFCFGTVSALSAFGIMGTPSSLAATLVAANPFLALVMCYVPRLLVPITVHLVHKLVSRSKPIARMALPASAAAGSLCNTVFYLGLMLLFYVMMGIEYANLLALIGGTGLIAGTAEAVAAAVISTPVVVALRKIRK